MSRDTSVKVSVLVMTYNHSMFIRQALDSVLIQKTDFRYEILITEDYSTDGTREIVQEYQQRFPQIIRLLLSDHNIRSNAVVRRGIEAAQGKYIALLDGDDYWTSPLKLQKQVDFLDSHTECSICFHNATVVSDEKTHQPWNWTPDNHPEFSTLEDIWMGNFIATCSTMFRKGLIGKVPVWYDAMFPITDWPLHILNAECGSIGYINYTMGAYRYHQAGYYSPLSERQKLEKTLEFYRTMNINTSHKYNKLIKRGISKYFCEWAEEYLIRGDREQAKICFNIALRNSHINVSISFRRLVKLGIGVYLNKKNNVNKLSG